MFKRNRPGYVLIVVIFIIAIMLSSAALAVGGGNNSNTEGSNDSSQGTEGPVGDIQINADPGLLVYVDGEFRKKTSADYDGAYLQDLPVGEHEIKVVKPGFNPRIFQVNVKKNETLLMKVKKLTPKIKIRQEGEEETGSVQAKVGRIIIRTIPINCRLSVLDQTYNKNKDKFIMEDVPYGQYDFDFEYKGLKMNYRLDLNCEDIMIKVDFRKETISVNHSPEILENEEQTADRNSELTIRLSALDPDEDELSFKLTGLTGPEGNSILKNERAVIDLKQAERDSALLSWNTGGLPPGNYLLEYEVSDGVFTDTGKLAVSLIDNAAPEFNLSFKQTTGKEVALEGSVSDPDDVITGLTINWGDGTSSEDMENAGVTLEHTYQKYGTYNPVVAINYQSRKEVSRTYSVTLSNQPPAFEEASDRKVTAGEKLSLEIKVRDPEGDSLEASLSAAVKAKGFKLKQIDSQNFNLTWQTEPGDAGSHPVTLVISDGYNARKIAFNIRVEENQPPELKLETSTEKREALIRGKAVDPEGNLSRLEIDWGDDRREKLTAEDIDFGAFTLRHNYSEYGKFVIQITAFDEQGINTTARRTIMASNHIPVAVDKINITGCIGVPIKYRIEARDGDGDDLEFSIEDIVFSSVYDAELIPIDRDSAKFRWTPGAADKGHYEIPVRVSDGEAAHDIKLTIDIKDEIAVLDRSQAALGEEAVFELPAPGFEGEPDLKILKFLNPDGKDILRQVGEHLDTGELQQGRVSWDTRGSKRGSYRLDYEARGRDSLILGSVEVDLYVQTALEKEIFAGKRIVFSIDPEKLFNLGREEEMGGGEDFQVSNKLTVIPVKMPDGASFNGERYLFNWHVPEGISKNKYEVLLKGLRGSEMDVRKIELIKTEYRGEYVFKSPPFRCDARGDLKWKYRVPGGDVEGMITAPDGSIYLRDSRSNLIALSPEGKEKWRKEGVMLSRHEGPGPVLTPRGDIIVEVKGGYLQEVDGDGRVIWKTKLDKNIRDIIALVDGSVIVRSKKMLYCLESDGEIRWQKEFPEIYSAVVGENGTIYFAPGDEEGYKLGVYALNQDGRLKWRAEINNHTDKHMDVKLYSGLDGVIYAASRGVVIAINSHGQTKWKQEIYASYESNLRVFEDTLYVQRVFEETYYALKTSSGERKFAIDGENLKPPSDFYQLIVYDEYNQVLIDGNNRVVCTDTYYDGEAFDSNLNFYAANNAFNDKLYAFDKTGKEKWVFDVKGNTFFFRIGADGCLYSCDTGKKTLLCIE